MLGVELDKVVGSNLWSRTCGVAWIAPDRSGPAVELNAGCILYPSGGCVVQASLDRGSDCTAHKGHSSHVSALAVSPDEQFVATGEVGEQSDVVIWRAKDWRQMYRLEEHDRGISSLVFSDDSEILLSGSCAGSASVFAWFPKSGLIAASAAVPGSLEVTSLVSGGYLKDLKRRPDPSKYLFAGVFGSFAHLILVDVKDRSMQLIPLAGSLQAGIIRETPTTQNPVTTASPITSAVVQMKNACCVCFSSDREVLYVGTNNGAVLSVGMRDINWMRTSLLTEQFGCSAVTSLVAVRSPKEDRDWVFVGSSTGIVAVLLGELRDSADSSADKIRPLSVLCMHSLSAPKRSLLRVQSLFPIRGSTGAGSTASGSDSSPLVLATVGAGDVHVLGVSRTSTSDWKLSAGLVFGGPTGVLSEACYSEGRLARWSNSSALKSNSSWNGQHHIMAVSGCDMYQIGAGMDHRLTAVVAQSRDAPYTCVDCSPDIIVAGTARGSILAYAPQQSTMIVSPLSELWEIPSVFPRSSVSKVAITSSLRYTLAGSEAGQISLWDLKGSKKCLGQLQSHVGPVSYLSLFPNLNQRDDSSAAAENSEEFALSASKKDRAFCTYDLRLMKPVTTHRSSVGGVLSCMLSPRDLSLVVTSHMEKVLTLWDLRSHDAVGMYSAGGAPITAMCPMQHPANWNAKASLDPGAISLTEYAFLCGASDGSISVRDARRLDHPPVYTIPSAVHFESTEGIVQLLMSSDGTQFVSLGSDIAATTWNVYWQDSKPVNIEPMSSPSKAQVSTKLTPTGASLEVPRLHLPTMHDRGARSPKSSN